MSEKRLHFYGRRKGRSLGKNLSNLMESLLPQVQIHIPEEILDPASLFNNSVQEICLEIGFGGGEHLAAQATQNPHVGFIGVEAYINGVASLLKHVQRENLQNVRIYHGDIRLLLPKLKPESITRLFILFPDPWPKKRHLKRRLICPENLQLFHALLTPQGVIRIASDDPSYTDWILTMFKESPLFRMPSGTEEDWKTPPADWHSTRYEQKAKEAGRKPLYIDFKKV